MTVPLPQSPPGAQTGLDLLLDQGIDGVIATIGATGITDIKQALLVSPVIPSIYDRRFLASCRTVLGRDLDMDEKKKMRAKLAAKIKATP